MLDKHFDLYAFSIITYSKNVAFYLAQKIKEANSQAKIILGGPQCFPAYDGLDILQNQNVDAICTGEGDLIWPLVLKHYAETKKLQLNIPGIAYKNDEGSIIDNGVPELVHDLNSLPFADFSSIDFSKYTRKKIYNLSVMTSRRCINSCAFCSERPNFYNYRYRRAENIIEEITQNLEHFHTNSSIAAIEDNSLTEGANNHENPNSIIPYISFNDSLITVLLKNLKGFAIW